MIEFLSSGVSPTAAIVAAIIGILLILLYAWYASRQAVTEFYKRYRAIPRIIIVPPDWDESKVLRADKRPVILVTRVKNELPLDQ